MRGIIRVYRARRFSRPLALGLLLRRGRQIVLERPAIDIGALLALGLLHVRGGDVALARVLDDEVGEHGEALVGEGPLHLAERADVERHVEARGLVEQSRDDAAVNAGRVRADARAVAEIEMLREIRDPVVVPVVLQRAELEYL